MLPSERIEKLQSLLAEKKFLNIKELKQEFNISRSTATRDLEYLIQQGLARRTRGGIMRIETHDSFECPKFSTNKYVPRLEEKRKIAAKAFELLTPPTTLFIDGGTTTMQLCPYLKTGDFRIITNSVGLACYLIQNSSLEVILAGGLVHKRGMITIGPNALQVIKSVHADWYIGSSGGIDEKGLTNTDLLTVEIEQQMIKQSSQTMFLLDHSKFGKKVLTYFTEFEAMDVLVTNAIPPPEIYNRLQNADVQVVIAD